MERALQRVPGTGFVTHPELRVFGIRHHGPGTARALLAALAAYEPDCILVEGPPDADGVIPWLAHPALVMPVALLVYRPDEPRRAAIYPFAAFSPEYRSLRYALEREIPVGFMDLPRRHALAVEHSAAMPAVELFQELAAAAGHESYEAWWNGAVEQKRGGDGVFDAVLDLMTEMRRAMAATRAGSAAETAAESPEERLARAREAAMRQRLRAAAAAGRRRIAAVCGAWHAPALAGALDQPAAADAALLAELPEAAVEATWVPWTYGRLTRAGGYGAGVASPGWYDHLWAAGEAGLSPDEMSAHWLSQVAALLREEGLDTSPGHVIETVRLAEALAALRGRPFPGLPELEEAVLSAMCGGQEEPLRLIRRRLIVGERMGTVPPDVPAVPLQRDLAAEQARLKLRPEPEKSVLKLDLRQETHLERSRLLHRLALIDVPWGTPAKPKGGRPGAYAELWQLQWLPDLSLRVIEAAMWGNTVRDAATARVADDVAHEIDLAALIERVDRVVAADLPEAMPAILARIEELAALSRDAGHAHVSHLLAALPPLADAVRYGSLRRTAEHLPLLRRVFDHLLTRACLSLPAACVSLDEAAATGMIEKLSAAAAAVRLSQDEDAATRWREALGKLADRRGIHPAVAGRATRLLHEEGTMRAEGVMTRLERALTPGGSPEVTRYAADWIDGFLRDSGLLLLHDRPLWSAIDRWLVGLGEERFRSVLPLLRRTFSTYPEGVRKQLQDRLRERERAPAAGRPRSPAFDEARAAAVLPVLGRILGLAPAHQEAT